MSKSAISDSLVKYTFEGFGSWRAKDPLNSISCCPRTINTRSPDSNVLLSPNIHASNFNAQSQPSLPKHKAPHPPHIPIPVLSLPTTTTTSLPPPQRQPPIKHIKLHAPIASRMTHAFLASWRDTIRRREPDVRAVAELCVYMLMSEFETCMYRIRQSKAHIPSLCMEVGSSSR